MRVHKPAVPPALRWAVACACGRWSIPSLPSPFSLFCSLLSPSLRCPHLVASLCPCSPFGAPSSAVPPIFPCFEFACGVFRAMCTGSINVCVEQPIVERYAALEIILQPLLPKLDVLLGCLGSGISHAPSLLSALQDWRRSLRISSSCQLSVRSARADLMSFSGVSSQVSHAMSLLCEWSRERVGGISHAPPLAPRQAT